MIFWILWGIGLVITFVTRAKITKSLKPFTKETEERWKNSTKPNVSQTSKKTQILLHLLVIICIVLVGGIAVAKFLGTFEKGQLFAQCVCGIIAAMLTYFVGYEVLGLYRFDSGKSQICFAVVFIISIFVWLFPIKSYNTNVETIKNYQTIEWTESRELVYFCGLPVQNISGEISGSSGIISGSISGNIDTTHELTYWYVGQNGSAEFGIAEAKNSEINFIEEGETPYVELIGYQRYESMIIDHNINLESGSYPYNWTQYIFHVPKTVMQSQLN